jgi:choice-of-anchor A domain-containing protein
VTGFHFKAAAVAILAFSIVACSSGLSGPQALSGIGSAPDKTGSNASPRHRQSWNLGTTQAVATGVMLQPLSVSVTGGVATLSLWGTTQCSAASGVNPCPNINFTASPPQWSSSSAVSMSFGATSLLSSCTAPSGAPSPAPGFTPACYLVAYEGGVGPYYMQGPGVPASGTLSFDANTSLLNFNGGNTGYDFFLAYVTNISASPPPPTPSPVPTATNLPSSTPVPATACAPFAILAANTRWANVHLQPNVTVQGDAGINAPGQFHAEQGSVIDGALRIVPGTQVQTNRTSISGGVVTDAAGIAAAVASAEKTNASDAALAPTNSTSAINIGKWQSASITGSAGVNVLDLSSLEMGENTTLTLSAPAGGSFVLNVSGEMRIGNTAKILVAGGLDASNVVLNFTGASGQVLVQYTSVVDGTILAPYRTNVHVDHTSVIDGAVVGDGAVMEFAWGSSIGGC